MALIKIINKRVPLDNTYENVIGFRDVSTYKKGETGQAVSVLTSTTPLKWLATQDASVNDESTYLHINFRYGNTLTTRVRINYEFAPLSLYDCNYCIVKQNDNNKLPSVLFYFINGISFERGVASPILDLELDVFTTFFRELTFNHEQVMCERFTADRYTSGENKDEFGCEEALHGDMIDGQFNANILKNSIPIDDNAKYLIVYLSLNAPTLEVNEMSSTGYSDLNKCKYLSYLYKSPNQDNLEELKGVPLPYQIAIIPLGKTNTLKFSFQDVLNPTPNYSSEIYYSIDKFAYSYQSNNSDYTNQNSYISKLIKSEYVLGLQVVNKNFNLPSVIKCTTKNDDFKICTMFKEQITFGSQQPLTYNCIEPILVLKSNAIDNIGLDNFTFTKNDILKYFYSKFEETDNYGLKKIYLEPKLYTSPYSHLVLSGASYKPLEINTLLAFEGDTLSISKIFTPNPNISGVSWVVKSGIYKYTRENYMTMSPTMSSEIPKVNSAYQEFLTSQKNSYYMGVALSYFNNLLQLGSAVGTTFSGVSSGNPINTFSGALSGVGAVGNMIATPFQVNAKMKDLKNTPDRLNSNNFDVYSVVGVTDLRTRFNVYQLLETEQQQVFDYYYKFGYQCEKLLNVGLESINVIYMNTSKTRLKLGERPTLFNRILFNYVKVKQDITNDLSGNYLSQEIRSKFNELFNRGIRIWNIKEGLEYKFLDFTLENSEAWR